MSSEKRPCLECGKELWNFQGTRCDDPCQKAYTELVAARLRAQVPAEMVRAARAKWALYTVYWLIASFFWGGAMAVYGRSQGGTGCVYRSFATLLAPAHVLGCEVFRARFELGGGKP